MSSTAPPTGFPVIQWNLHEQILANMAKTPVQLNILVMGAPGLGKSTFINSCFDSSIYDETVWPGPSQRHADAIETRIEKTDILLRDKRDCHHDNGSAAPSSKHARNGVVETNAGRATLHLTVLDAPGFGTAIDSSNCWQPVIDHIDSKFAEFLKNEMKINRRRGDTIVDSRVHCCLYFLDSGRHGLKQLDIEILKRLQDKVNIIPVIAKADTLTVEELRAYKKTIQRDLELNKIKCYTFPDFSSRAYAGVDVRSYENMWSRAPFAVIGSNTRIEHNGRTIRARKYPWGVVDIENQEYSDFLALRTLLLQIFCADLLQTTHTVLFNRFRVAKLRKILAKRQAVLDKSGDKVSAVSGDQNAENLYRLLEERRLREEKLSQLNGEMETSFTARVQQKQQRLADLETEMAKRREQIERNMEIQRSEIRDRRARLLEEQIRYNRDFGHLAERLEEAGGKKKLTKKLFNH